MCGSVRSSELGGKNEPAPCRSVSHLRQDAAKQPVWAVLRDAVRPIRSRAQLSVMMFDVNFELCPGHVTHLDLDLFYPV